MPEYNYSPDEFPEYGLVHEELSWAEILELCARLGVAIPTFLLSLITHPLSQKPTNAFTSAFASASRYLLGSMSGKDTVQKVAYFQPLQKTMAKMSTFKETRGYNVRFTDAKNSISRWVYEKEARTRDDPVMVFIHGGGFQLKTSPSHIAHVHSICKETGISALLVDYGTIPYFRFPSQLDQCIDTVEALQNTCSKIIIAGDSAGGNLAAASILKLKELGTPAWGFYAVAPWVQLYPRETGSWVDNANLDWISPERLRKGAEKYLGNDECANNKLAQPYLATEGDWKGAMPKNSIIVYGKCEIFADQCKVLAEKAGVTSVFAQEKAIHDYNIILEKTGPANDFVFNTIKSWLK